MTQPSMHRIKSVVLRRRTAAGAGTFAPNPAEDLVFRGGRVLPALAFKTFYVGKSWTNRAADMTNVDDAIRAAMTDDGLNAVMMQYFGGEKITTQALASAVLDTAESPRFDKGAIERLVARVFTSGALAGIDLTQTVVSFVLAPGTVLSSDGGGAAKLPRGPAPPGGPEHEEADSLNGLGGYHGSIHVPQASGAATIYYSVAVWSAETNGIAVPGWQPWENVVATMYHELNEARTDPDVEDAVRTGDLRFIGWNSNGGSEIGDFPIEEAGEDLTTVFKKVKIGANDVPIQLMWSNRTHGPEAAGKAPAASALRIVALDATRVAPTARAAGTGEALSAGAGITLTPPANLTDFKAAESAGLWNDWLSSVFDGVVISTQQYLNGLPSQYFNPAQGAPMGTPVELRIAWQGFPRTLEQATGVGTKATWESAERIQGTMVARYMNQDEYLEWFVTRDRTGKILRVDFTCEGPEYWDFLAQNEPNTLLALYQKHIDPKVALNDLIANGVYQPHNRYNLTLGAMHLIQPANNLGAEVQIAGDATILRQDAIGNPITDAQALIKCAGYGVPTRASDPHIGDLVNGLARDGYVISIKNPVGLYMSRPNLAGFQTPDKQDVTQEWFQITRGSEQFPVRASFMAPNGSKWSVGDITIGGVPLAWGGQIAKNMQMSLTGIAYGKGSVRSPSFPCGGPPRTHALAPSTSLSRNLR